MNYFSINFFSLIWAALLGILFWVVYQKQKRDSFTLFFPDVSKIETSTFFQRFIFTKAPEYCSKITLGLFFLALLDPQIRTQHAAPESKYHPLPKEGVAVYLILDRSSSMKDPLLSTELGNLYHFPSKIEILKNLVTDFIKNRPQDLIGLVTFARTAEIISPLTLDHQAILNKVKQLQVVSNKEEDGSAIGYAIFKTASFIRATQYFSKINENKPAYQIKDAVMILLTDGVQEINPEDQGKKLRSMEIEDAAQYAKELGIRLYLIMIARQGELSEVYLNMLQRSTQSTGGRLFSASDSNQLKSTFEDINKMEKSIVPLPAKEPSEISSRKFSFYPFLILTGLIFLFAGILLETMLVRRVP